MAPSGFAMSWVNQPTGSPCWRQAREPRARTSNASSQRSWRSGFDSSESSSSSPESSSPPSCCGSSPPSSRGSSPPSRAWESDWRAPRVSRTPSPVEDAKPAFEDLRPGMVMHLPRQEEVPGSSIFHERMAKRDDKPWGHPLVVLEKASVSGEEMVRCQLVTSFRDGETFARKSEVSKEYIALIQNTANIMAHRGLNGVQTRLLTLEPGSDQFPKLSFVNFFDKDGPDAVTFWIEYKNIQPLLTARGQRNIVFDQESLERIKNKQVR